MVKGGFKTTAERVSKISEYIREQGGNLVSVDNISEHFGLPPATVRRALVTLKEDKDFSRQHGGVRYRGPDANIGSIASYIFERIIEEGHAHVGTIIDRDTSTDLFLLRREYLKHHPRKKLELYIGGYIPDPQGLKSGIEAMAKDAAMVYPVLIGSIYSIISDDRGLQLGYPEYNLTPEQVRPVTALVINVDGLTLDGKILQDDTNHLNILVSFLLNQVEYRVAYLIVDSLTFGTNKRKFPDIEISDKDKIRYIMDLSGVQEKERILEQAREMRLEVVGNKNDVYEFKHQNG